MRFESHDSKPCQQLSCAECFYERQRDAPERKYMYTSVYSDLHKLVQIIHSGYSAIKGYQQDTYHKGENRSGLKADC